MGKKPLVIISTDWHIKSDNTEQIVDLIRQKIDLAMGLDVGELICLGDVFQSRQAQPLLVLKCFERILDMIKDAKMTLHCISGNHDKTNYSSEDSFLDQFSWHPALKLYRNYEVVGFGRYHFHFLPYFEEKFWIKNLHQPISDNGFSDILFSHQAFTGSVNNDNSKVSNSINPSVVGLFRKVFLGHYHNQQRIGDNIFHLPSIQANDFGEDNDKGFTVLYSDSNHELVTSKFREYHTVDIDLDRIDKKDLNDLKRQGKELYEEHGANIRFKITGSEDKVQSLNKEEFESLGITIQKQHKSVVKSIERANLGEINVYDGKKILDKFEEFCKQEGYEDIEYGKDCLIKKLNKI